MISKLTKFENLKIPLNITTILLILILLIGVFLRIHGISTRSISSDEPSDALGLSQKSISEMLFTDFGKQAIVSEERLLRIRPVFYSVSIHYIAKLKNTEWTLRLIPLIFGVGSCFLIFLLSKKLTKSSFVSLNSTALLSFNIIMIYFSKELKHYSIDVFFSILLLYLTELYLERRSASSFLWLLLLTIIGVGFSYGVIFIVGSIILLLSYKALIEKRTRVLKHLSIYIFAVFIWIATLYQLVFRKQMSSLIVSDWSESFPKLSIISMVTFITKSIVMFFVYIFAGSTFWVKDNKLIYLALLMFVLFAMSLFLLWYNKMKRILFYTFIPIILTLIAALLKKYPFSALDPRVNLYLAPMIFICIAYGIVHFLNYLKKINIKLFHIIFIIVLFSFAIPTINTERNMFNYPRSIYPNDGMRELVKEYLDERAPGDVVYIFYNAKLGFKYYYKYYYKQTDYNNIYLSEGNKWYNNVSYLENNRTYLNNVKYYLENEVLPIISKHKDQRLWIFLSQGLKDDVNLLLRAYMQNFCKEINKYEKYNSSAAYIYDCSNIGESKEVHIYLFSSLESNGLLIQINNGHWMLYSVEEAKVIDPGPFFINYDTGELTKEVMIIKP